jgi:hypothetical protein
MPIEHSSPSKTMPYEHTGPFLRRYMVGFVTNVPKYMENEVFRMGLGRRATAGTPDDRQAADLTIPRKRAQPPASPFDWT